MTPARVMERVLAKVVPEGDCLVSTYSTGSHGYSQIGWWADGKNHMRLGHRVAYESANGPIPVDMTIDHTCRNRRCINLDHLLLLSNEDNSCDNGMARRTHCPRGHVYDEANTYLQPSTGHRSCRACAAERRDRMNNNRGSF